MIQNPGSASLLRKPRGRPTLAVCVALLIALAVGVSAVSLAWAATDSFPDVPQGHPYYAAVLDLAERGIIDGYPDGSFGPSNLVTRQQFAKMIVLAGGYPASETDVCPFGDVIVSGPGDLYPDNYVAVAAQQGITLGLTSGTFGPHANITRYQLLSMVVRTADDLRPGLLSAPPSGWTGSAGWANDPVHGGNAARAEYNGLLAGIALSGLSPYGPMTRGEVAQVLHNLLATLTPPATTTTTSGPTTTAPVSTTTTASTTTTTTASTTTSSVPASTSTTTSTAPAAKIDYAVAGLEQNTVTVRVLDQFGRGYPGISVYLTTSQLEGAGLSLLTDLLIGTTDGDGYVAHTWGQNTPGAWGVEQVMVTVDDGSIDGKTWLYGTIQWIYDDDAAGTGYVSATNGQQKVTVAAGLSEWNGKVLWAYLNPLGASLGSATYVSAALLSLTTSTHTWVTGQSFFVRADSSNTDGKRNWMYSVVSP